MLTFQEFLLLSYKEREERFTELSPHDRFQARTSDWKPEQLTREEYERPHRPEDFDYGEEELEKIMRIFRGEETAPHTGESGPGGSND